MKMKNSTYDILKYIAIQVIPALEVFIIGVGEIWDLSIMTKIAATVAAFGVFLGAILIKSHNDYKANSIQTTFNADSVEELYEVESYETDNEATEK